MTFVMTTDEFLQAVFKTVRQSVDDKDQQHPEDIMSTVTLVTETIYQFISHTPSKIWYKNE